MKKVKPHIFNDKALDICVKNTISGIVSPCAKPRNHPIHIEKKIIKNIHPPKDPAKRRKIGWETKRKVKRKLKKKMAKISRKVNRA